MPDHILHHCDAIDGLQWLAKELPDKKFQLCFVDPPFNIGVDYGAGINDSRSPHDFQHWTRSWMRACHGLLEAHGSLWLNIPDSMAEWVPFFARADLDLHLVNWCVWHYRFGQNQDTKFTCGKTHSLWYAKNLPHVFYRENVLVPSERQALGDWRACEGGKTPTDVWGFEPFWGRVQGNNKERVPCAPNQLPEEYLKRVVLATTLPGDWVLDPFMGGGTTRAVCWALGRNFVGFELNRERFDAAAARKAIRV